MQRNVRRCGRVIPPQELGLTRKDLLRLHKMRTALGRHPEATPEKVTTLLQYALELAKSDQGPFLEFLG